ncbi:winged helix family transcriptional regulator [Moritella marina ATCC 15381]|uniref:Winged helix family transcriptional regulator n=1 Tax=Moritella marina ATCC 15381 TaxID=1202962 RepID=A0A5J6WN81_MORMI|nr:winged helix-turn-helix domain-containing protein [Moritella marina]QFI39437.1 winged helix family transcriptional regulator [Moritella marina ATCC 15381]
MIHKQPVTQYISIDPEMRAVTCLLSSITVSMRPLPFRVFMYLLKNQDQCISRDELFEECWQGAIVSEQSLTNTISYIRKTIKKLESNELKLNTISKKGYSLVITFNHEFPEDIHNEALKKSIEDSDETQVLDDVIELDDGPSESDKDNDLNRIFSENKKINLPAVKGNYVRSMWFFVNLILLSTLIFLIAKNNMSNASFMDEKNYQHYRLDNIDVYISDSDRLLVESDFRKALYASNLNSCDMNKVYIRVYSSPYNKDNIAMSAFIKTKNSESHNIINYKLVDGETYNSILDSIQDDHLCHGSSISH